MSARPGITARGSGIPGRGGPRRWPTKWRWWIRQSPARKNALHRVELTLRSVGVGYKTTQPYAFLLSFPRSGNHLIRYVIESISGYSTWGAAAGVGRRFTSRSPDTPIFLKVPMRIRSRRAIVIKRHQMRDSDDRDMPIVLLVRRPDHAIVSHLGTARIETHLHDFVDDFVNMCASVDSWPAPTSIHFLESFTHGSDDEFVEVTRRLLTDCHLTNFERQLERFREHRSEHFARAIWSLERRPTSGKIDWSSPTIRHACDDIAGLLNRHREESSTLGHILSHYFDETPSKPQNRQN